MQVELAQMTELAVVSKERVASILSGMEGLRLGLKSLHRESVTSILSEMEVLRKDLKGLR